MSSSHAPFATISDLGMVLEDFDRIVGTRIVVRHDRIDMAARYSSVSGRSRASLRTRVRPTMEALLPSSATLPVMILCCREAAKPSPRPDRREHGLRRRNTLERERAQPAQPLLRQAALERIGQQEPLVQLAAEIGDACGKIHVGADHRSRDGRPSRHCRRRRGRNEARCLRRNRDLSLRYAPRPEETARAAAKARKQASLSASSPARKMARIPSPRELQHLAAALIDRRHDAS